MVLHLIEKEKIIFIFKCFLVGKCLAKVRRTKCFHLPGPIKGFHNTYCSQR